MSKEFPAYTLEELEDHPDLMKFMAIIDLRGYAAAAEQMDKQDGAKHLPEYWRDLVLEVREANVREDKAKRKRRR